MDIQITTIPVIRSAAQTNASDTLEATVTLVELNGEVSYGTAAKVEAELLPLAQPDVLLVLNMVQVSYMSSAGLRMLLSLYRRVQAQNGKIVLVGLLEEIRDAMSVTGFLDFFLDCDTLESAFQTLQVQPASQPAT